MIQFNGIRSVPNYKYLLQDNFLPTIDDYGDLNDFITTRKRIKNSEIETLLKKDATWSLLFYNLIFLNLAKFVYVLKTKETGEIRVIGMNNEDYNLVESSSGFLQIFPILKTYFCDALFLNRPIFIQQPELHLHPNAQAELADVFSYFISNKSSSINYPRLIIETHSEHLIRKLQVLIASKKINKEDVSINYFYNVNGETKIKQMVIEDNGFFKDIWPNGFFDNSYNLAKELIQASNN